MKHIFIINPCSGKGESVKCKDIIEKIFVDRLDEYEIIQTEYPGHAVEICRNYSITEEIRFYSIGGDGTLNEIINGLSSTTVPIGVIPTGSGNDYVKTVYPKGERYNDDPERFIRSLLDGDVVPYSLGKINESEFINIASIGFDAHVVECAKFFKKYRYISGSVAYTLGIFTALMTFKKKRLQVSFDEDSRLYNTFLIAFGIGKYYGGGMKVLPKAGNPSEEGLIDVCLVHDISKLKVLFLFPKLIRGEHLGDDLKKYITYKKVQKLEIQSNENMILNLDGELQEWGDFVTSCLDEKTIPIIVPSKSKVLAH